MKAFRILLALITAGATFYGLNVLAMQQGYPDRLDLKNKNYHQQDCKNRSVKNHHQMQSQQFYIDPISNK